MRLLAILLATLPLALGACSTLEAVTDPVTRAALDAMEQPPRASVEIIVRPRT